VNRTSLRIAAVVLSLTSVSGCSAIQDSKIFQPEFWASNRSGDNVSAELGLAELSKGNNMLAQSHFEKALKANPKDVHALFGLATLYQNAGRPTRAHQLYEAILALNPRPTDELLVWAGKQTQPIVNLAHLNIQLLESGGSAPLPVGANPQPQMSSAAPMAMAPMQTPPSYGDMVSAQPQDMADPEPMFKDADLNIVARFKALRALLDQGLITQDEFLNRRKVNVGALLPMTSQPAATGLDRPVPAVEQVSARLNAIGRALEMRALSPAQHTAERSMIIDALMPMHPSSVLYPPPPPKGLMEAADAVRRLEMLNSADLITSDEYAKERAAIEASLQPSAPKAMDGAGAVPKMLDGQAKPAMSGFQPAVHLASYRQKKVAERGWAELSKRFGSLLGGLVHRVERVDLGNSKGVFYRLKAGPLPSNNAAKDACRQLKAKRQYCEPTTINFG